MKQTILCFDFEWVFIPEILVEVAKITGIKELELTTKDIANCDELMMHRQKYFDKNNITLSFIQDIVSKMSPFDWAIEFLDWARSNYQVIILSDTFEEFAKPMMKKIWFPTIF